jgi:hypothetical protein
VAAATDATRVKLATILVGATLFLVLATANAGGYRYGVSDQAYYATAVLKARTPTLFPRDSPMFAAQSSVLASDKILAALSRVFGLDLPALFLVTQVVTLIALAGAAVALGRALGFSWTATSLFLALLTLRHHIMNTGANTLEGYMHPRMLAFALGLLALVAVLRRRPTVIVAGLAGAGLAHPTTAAWFVIVAGVATFVDRPSWRLPLVAAAVALALGAGWAVTAGPLAGHLVLMDPTWLAVIADRDYLFSSRWPLAAWAVNLGYLTFILFTYRQRHARGVAASAEGALVVGWVALVVLFLASVPFEAYSVALVIQAQVNRVFWLLDVAATAYLAWWLLRGPLGTTRVRRAVTLSLVLALSAVRGTYVVTHADGRHLVDPSLPKTPWTATMTWLSEQSPSWNVLADPAHAWKYGSSVRVAAARDTVLELGKDPALAIYDRATAVRVAARERALSGFDAFTTDDVRRVAQQFSADVVVMTRQQPLHLPILYENAAFVVYDAR